MKKLIVLFTYILFCCLSLSAWSHSGNVWLAITPRDGAYGVNIASTKYRSDLASVQSQNYWAGFDLSDVTSDGEYSDDNIIAVGSINDEREPVRTTSGATDYYVQYSLDCQSMDIEVTCSNGEFCFVSESNPTYKRPFELMVFYEKHIATSSSAEKVSARGFYNVKNPPEDGLSTPGQTVSGGTWGAGVSAAEVLSYTHFNLVLALPGEEDENGNLEYNNHTYPLINADDYTAVVTITLTSDNAATQIISIPFSGYFNGFNENVNSKHDDVVSVSINRYPAASNLDIKALSNPNDSPSSVPVAHITMMYYYGDPNRDEATYGNSLNPEDVKMFFSASNNPTSGSNGFELLHSSVNYSTVHNEYNSIGYTISANTSGAVNASGELEVQYTNPSTLDSIPASGGSVSFTGSEYYDSGSLLGGNSTFLYPTVYHAFSSFGDTAEAAYNDRNHYWQYAMWESDVYLTMDKRKSEQQHMFAGRYTSTVYFHVIGPD